MRALSGQSMLRIWEDGQGRLPWARALLLLEAAEPGADRAALARLPVGERDARLLELRAAVFGDALSSLADCPACGERLELTFSVSDVRSPSPEAGPPFVFEAVNLRVVFRLPDSADLEALAPGPGAAEALLDACVSEVMRGGAAAPLSDLDAGERAALVARMGEVDPRADPKAGMVCPSCGHAWSAPFDIVAFFWEELGAWVRRVLAEVHVLARAYGWREEDVLALSPWRRRQYIGLVRA
jgi:hypothetical protein